MTMTVPAVFENGVLRPLLPLHLWDGQQIQVFVATEPENDTRSLQETLLKRNMKPRLMSSQPGLMTFLLFRISPSRAKAFTRAADALVGGHEHLVAPDASH